MDSSAVKDEMRIPRKGWTKRASTGNSDIKHRLFNSPVPLIESLRDACYERYRSEFLDKVLDHGRFILVCLSSSQGDLSESASDLTLNNAVDQSWISEGRDLDNAFQLYERAVDLLKKENQKSKLEGEKKIKQSVDQGFPHAMYTYALITFGKVVQRYSDGYFLVWEVDFCEDNDPRLQKQVEKAVFCLLDQNLQYWFHPLPIFLLGMMQLYNIGNCGNMIESKSGSSWRECLFDVLRATKGTSLINENERLGISSTIKYSKTCIAPECINVLEGGRKDLEWMVQCTKYELAVHIISDSNFQKDLVVAKSLLQELCKDGFVVAKCMYMAVLVGNISKIKGVETKEEAYNFLKEAAIAGHKEAWILIGTLPYRQGFRFLNNKEYKSWKKVCIDYLEKCAKYDEGIYANNKGNKEAAVLLLAKELSSFDISSTKKVLREGGYIDALKELEYNLQRGQGQTALSQEIDLLIAKVYSELEQCEPSFAKQLSHSVGRLNNILQVMVSNHLMLNNSNYY